MNLVVAHRALKLASTTEDVINEDLFLLAVQFERPAKDHLRRVGIFGQRKIGLAFEEGGNL
ncbi:MAG: hypothetical protein IPM06_18480 [Rhizobiales bacterium]|nr:hypothetical protein [Hyphomicrobiales bacterium]